MTIASQKRLLLHVCCAPCSTHVIESLREKFDLTCYFYNPNIWPISEYCARLEEARSFCRNVRIPIIAGTYDNGIWKMAIRGLEDEPEGKKRCEACFYFRLLDTARKAVLLGIGFFGTTLTISPHKKTVRVNSTGKRAGNSAGIAFYEADFKKNDGFQRSIELSKEHRLYRQRYCGCKYSIKTP